jgi:hypothetical protein
MGLVQEVAFPSNFVFLDLALLVQTLPFLSHLRVSNLGALDRATQIEPLFQSTIFKEQPPFQFVWGKNVVCQGLK